MPTKKPRISVTYDMETYCKLQKVCKDIGISMSSYVKALTLNAIKYDYSPIFIPQSLEGKKERK